MGYRMIKRKDHGETMYEIVDSDGVTVSEWDDVEEARAELHDLNDYAQDVVDFMQTSTPGLGSEAGDDEDTDDCLP